MGGLVDRWKGSYWSELYWITHYKWSSAEVHGRPWDMLCFICINNLEEDAEWALIKFVDAKLCDASDLLKGRASIQRDLDMLQAWAGRTSVKFDEDKVLHLGQTKPHSCTGWGAAWIKRTWGSRWPVSLSPQHMLSAMKANRRLGCISKSLACR